MYHYQVSGFELRSELELGIPAINGTDMAEVTIRYGKVPPSLPDVAGRGASFESAPGQLLLKAPNVGRYLVQNGREIIIHPDNGVSKADIRTFLFGSAFGALFHQRSFVPLHASSIRVGDGCVAFAGCSGVGKSTLVAFLQQRGYTIVADDISPLRNLTDSKTVVFPGLPRLKLWANSLKALGVDDASYPRVRQELEKYEIPTERQIQTPFLPLRRVYVLNEARDPDPEGIEPIDGTACLQALLSWTYRSRYLDGFGRKVDHFRICATVVKQAEFFRLRRPWRIERISEVLDWLEDHWKDIGESRSARGSKLNAAA